MLKPGGRKFTLKSLSVFLRFYFFISIFIFTMFTLNNEYNFNYEWERKHFLILDLKVNTWGD